MGITIVGNKQIPIIQNGFKFLVFAASMMVKTHKAKIANDTMSIGA